MKTKKAIVYGASIIVFAMMTVTAYPQLSNAVQTSGHADQYAGGTGVGNPGTSGIVRPGTVKPGGKV